MQLKTRGAVIIQPISMAMRCANRNTVDKRIPTDFVYIILEPVLVDSEGEERFRNAMF